MLTLVWIGMVTYVGVRVISRIPLQFSLASCLPSDFPHYPGAKLATLVVTDPRGACIVTYQTNDSELEVESFYKTNLNQGDWTVTGEDEQNHIIRFRRISQPKVTGAVTVNSLIPGQPTQIQIGMRTRR